jgi:transcriptional regulator with XRE-family HTH domain
MVLLRHLLGDALRRLRLRQGRTLREVSAAARVSLGYLSEVERGQKEASSELLASICGALGAPLSHVLREVSDNFALAELQSEPVFAGVRERSPDVPPGPETSEDTGGKRPVGPVASQLMGVPAGTRMPVPAGTRLPVPAAGTRLPVPAGTRLPAPAGTRVPVPAGQRLVMPARQRLGSRAGQGLIPPQEPLLDPAALPVVQPAYDQVARTGRDITNMVPV